MARRSNSAPSEEPKLNAQQIQNRIERINRCIDDVEALDVSTVNKRYGDPQVETIEAAIKDALLSSFGHDTPAYNLFYRATSIDQGPHVLKMDSPFGRGGYVDHAAKEAREARQYLTEGKPRTVALLRQAVRNLEARLADLQPDVGPKPPASATSRRKIFVVHGHDEAALQAVARFLEKIDLEPIVLKEQPDRGLTIIEKFVRYAGMATFAIVLLTPDDVGGSAASANTSERARQNVIFELGFFVGQLGRGHVCLLRKGGVEMPSDLSGVVYGEMDISDSWKLKLIQELKAANVELDANKLWS